MRRYAVPKFTESGADRRAERIFVDIWGPFFETSIDSKRFAMQCVDDFTRFKFISFPQTQEATPRRRYGTLSTRRSRPAGLKVGIIGTDGGGEFEEQFQSLPTEYEIKREFTPPYTPQYNGVVERALGLLRDKTVALLRGVTEGRSDRLWAKAMNYACEVSNRSVTSSLDRGVSPYELWHGRRPTFNNILPFGTVGYLRRP